MTFAFQQSSTKVVGLATQTKGPVMTEHRKLLIAGSFGEKIPQRFALEFKAPDWSLNGNDWYMRALKKGPENPKYWDAWEYVKNNASYTDVLGLMWWLEIDGDLYAATDLAELQRKHNGPTIELQAEPQAQLPAIAPPPLDAFEETRPAGTRGNRLESVIVRRHSHKGGKNKGSESVRLVVPRFIMEQCFGKEYMAKTYDWRRGKAPNDRWIRVYAVMKGGTGLKPSELSGLSVSITSLFEMPKMELDTNLPIEHHIKDDGLYLYVTENVVRALKDR